MRSAMRLLKEQAGDMASKAQLVAQAAAAERAAADASLSEAREELQAEQHRASALQVRHICCGVSILLFH